MARNPTIGMLVSSLTRERFVRKAPVRSFQLTLSWAKHSLMIVGTQQSTVSLGEAAAAPATGGASAGGGKSVSEALPGCWSKRTKSSWLNCRAALCGRCNLSGGIKNLVTKKNYLKQVFGRSLLNILLLLGLKFSNAPQLRSTTPWRHYQNMFQGK